MRLNFRQGLVITQPGYMVYDGPHNTVDISLDPNTSITATATYKSKDFLLVENNDTNAWGPMVWNPTWGIQPGGLIYYLYWDINLASGAITKNFTPHSVIYSTVPPSLNPAIDQHWYDLSVNVMKVWSGTYWIPVIRVFAGSFQVSGHIISQYAPGSQAMINGTFDAGFILYGTDLRGIKDSTGEFVSTTTPIITNQGSYTSPLRLELVSPTAIAAEVIPAFYCVTSNKNNKVGLASILNGKRPIGIVDVDCMPGSAVDIIVHGLAFNDSWNWDQNLSQELYCGLNGEIVQTPSNNPTVENIRIGIALSPQSALIDIDFYGSSGGQGPRGPTGPAGVGLPGPTGPMGPAGSIFSIYAKQNNDVVALPIGTPVYSSGIGTISRAKADSGISAQVTGVVSDPSISVGATGSIQTVEILTATTAQWDIVTGQVGGLTEGSNYYLSSSTAGTLTSTAPTVAGQYVVNVGKAISSTQLSINIQAFVLL
jgi:hypothetical protein